MFGSKVRTPPLWLKIAYSLFVAVLVPVYLKNYGPTNFLYFCDMALPLTLISLWSGNMLVGIGLCRGHPATPGRVDGGFHRQRPRPAAHGHDRLYVQRCPAALHALHVFVSLLAAAAAALSRRNRNARAIWLWWPLATLLMVLSYLFVPPPPAPINNPGLPVNINYVYGLGDAAAQDWMSQLAYFLLIPVALPIVVFWPTHLVLRRFCPPARVRNRRMFT